jgi:8-oxo-dGTP diphosphatase
VCSDKVLIFDEAQRFWSKVESAEKGKWPSNITPVSDAEGIIGINYAGDITLVALIGNGQRPMKGEAGIEAWIQALQNDSSWQVHVTKEYAAQFEAALGNRAITHKELFLDTAMRAEFVDNAPFVEAVLNADVEKARKEYAIIKDKTQILLTRDFSSLYSMVHGRRSTLQGIKDREERKRPDGTLGREYLYGVLCSAKAEDREIDKYLAGRLKGKKKYQENNRAGQWYSGGCCVENPISVATETFCQGLEIDLPILLFGGDYYLAEEGGVLTWKIRDNYQTRQLPENERATIMQDTYRILMTRTTKNMFFYIPETPLLDRTYEFFKEVGIEEWKKIGG